jgi:hypothetical protein
MPTFIQRTLLHLADLKLLPLACAGVVVVEILLPVGSGGGGSACMVMLFVSAAPPWRQQLQEQVLQEIRAASLCCVHFCSPCA